MQNLPTTGRDLGTIVDRRGWTLGTLAARAKDTSLVELLPADFSMNIPDCNGLTPLLHAVSWPDFDCNWGANLPAERAACALDEPVPQRQSADIVREIVARSA